MRRAPHRPATGRLRWNVLSPSIAVAIGPSVEFVASRRREVYIVVSLGFNAHGCIFVARGGRLPL